MAKTPKSTSSKNSKDLLGVETMPNSEVFNFASPLAKGKSVNSSSSVTSPMQGIKVGLVEGLSEVKSPVSPLSNRHFRTPHEAKQSSPVVSLPTIIEGVNEEADEEINLGPAPKSLGPVREEKLPLSLDNEADTGPTLREVVADDGEDEPASSAPLRISTNQDLDLELLEDEKLGGDFFYEVNNNAQEEFTPSQILEYITDEGVSNLIIDKLIVNLPALLLQVIKQPTAMLDTLAKGIAELHCDDVSVAITEVPPAVLEGLAENKEGDDWDQKFTHEGKVWTRRVRDQAALTSFYPNITTLSYAQQVRLTDIWSGMRQIYSPIWLFGYNYAKEEVQLLEVAKLTKKIQSDVLDTAFIRILEEFKGDIFDGNTCEISEAFKAYLAEKITSHANDALLEPLLASLLRQTIPVLKKGEEDNISDRSADEILKQRQIIQYKISKLKARFGKQYSQFLVWVITYVNRQCPKIGDNEQINIAQKEVGFALGQIKHLEEQAAQETQLTLLFGDILYKIFTHLYKFTILQRTYEKAKAIGNDVILLIETVEKVFEALELIDDLIEDIPRAERGALRAKLEAFLERLKPEIRERLSQDVQEQDENTLRLMLKEIETHIVAVQQKRPQLDDAPSNLMGRIKSFLSGRRDSITEQSVAYEEPTVDEAKELVIDDSEQEVVETISADPVEERKLTSVLKQSNTRKVHKSVNFWGYDNEYYDPPLFIVAPVAELTALQISEDLSEFKSVITSIKAKLSAYFPEVFLQLVKQPEVLDELGRVMGEFRCNGRPAALSEAHPDVFEGLSKAPIDGSSIASFSYEEKLWTRLSRSQNQLARICPKINGLTYAQKITLTNLYMGFFDIYNTIVVPYEIRLGELVDLPDAENVEHNSFWEAKAQSQVLKLRQALASVINEKFVEILQGFNENIFISDTCHISNAFKQYLREKVNISENHLERQAASNSVSYIDTMMVNLQREYIATLIERNRKYVTGADEIPKQLESIEQKVQQLRIKLGEKCPDLLAVMNSYVEHHYGTIRHPLSEHAKVSAAFNELQMLQEKAEQESRPVNLFGDLVYKMNAVILPKFITVRKLIEESKTAYGKLMRVLEAIEVENALNVLKSAEEVSSEVLEYEEINLLKNQLQASLQKLFAIEQEERLESILAKIKEETAALERMVFDAKWEESVFTPRIQRNIPHSAEEDVEAIEPLLEQKAEVQVEAASVVEDRKAEIDGQPEEQQVQPNVFIDAFGLITIAGGVACFGLGWVGLSAAVAAMFVGGAMAVINHVSSPEASDQPRNDTFSPPVGGSTWVWAIASMKDNGHHRRSIPQAVPSPVDQVAALASVPVDIPLEPVDRSALNDQSPSALALALDGKHNDQVSNKPIDQSVTPGEHEPGRPKTDKHVSGADWVSQNILAIQIPQDEGPKRDSYSPKRKGSEDTLESFSPTKKQRSSSSFSFATGTGTAADVREDQEEAFKVAVKCKL